jgi:hypothetical protein
MIAPLVPELSYVDEGAGQPCIPRAAFIVDRRSEMILCTRLASGDSPLGEAVGPALVAALEKVKMRPTAICVDNERLAATLQSALDGIGVSVHVATLTAAPKAWAEFDSYFRTQTPR